METPEKPEMKQLNKLLDFFKKNYPFPQKNLAETKKSLNKITEDVYSEINENMTNLRGYELREYERYVSDTLYRFNLKGYLDVIDEPKVLEFMQRINVEIVNEPRTIDKYPLTDLYEEGMTELEQQERLELHRKTSELLAGKRWKIVQFLEAAVLHCKKVELTGLKDEEVIHEDLNREKQEYCFLLLNALQEESLEYQEPHLESFRNEVNNIFEEQRTEILGNYYDLPTQYTRLYLAQMSELFLEAGENIQKINEWKPALKEFRKWVLAQIEEFLLLISSLQEQQATTVYLKKVDEVLQKGCEFSRFLINTRSQIAEMVREKLSDQFEEIFLIELAGFSREFIQEKRELLERPVSTWPGYEKKCSEEVDEYLERISRGKNSRESLLD